jgi:hypothetical protein
MPVLGFRDRIRQFHQPAIGFAAFFGGLHVLFEMFRQHSQGVGDAANLSAIMPKSESRSSSTFGALDWPILMLMRPNWLPIGLIHQVMGLIDWVTSPDKGILKVDI